MHPRVTLDTSDLRSRLRTTPVTHRSSSYQARRRIRGEYQPVLSAPKPKLPSKYHMPAKTLFTKEPGQHTPRKTNDIAALIQQPQVSFPDHQTKHQSPVTAKSRPALFPKSASSFRGQVAQVHVPQPTRVLARSYVQKPMAAPQPAQKGFTFFKIPKLSQGQLVMTMAVCIFVVGMGVSVMGFYANKMASAQALSTNKQVDAAAATAKPAADTPDPGAPSTSPVSSSAVRSYTVAPDLARYITIPSIGVHARVLQVGVTHDGALGTPANVFDTAWYTGSAKPGQPGATLIDGHVSSWTTNGVFYDIKKLNTGDQIQIEKGDGQVLTYAVSKVIAYDANNVDMKALMLPVDPAKSGLNLITCGGKYDRSSKEFTQRIAVFAVLQ